MAKRKRRSSGMILGGRATDVLKVLEAMLREVEREERARSRRRKGRRKKGRNAAPLGTGARFRKLVKELEAKARRTGYPVRNVRALAAAIGRRKYGKRKFQQLAAHGKWRAKAARARARRKAANPRRRRKAC